MARWGVAVYQLGKRVRDKLFSVAIAGSFEAFGSKTVIQMPVRIYGEGRIKIGSGVFVGAGSWLQTLNEGVVTIGDGCGLTGNVTIAASGNVTLGNKVLFARGVYVCDYTHVVADIHTPILDQGETPSRPIEICDGAWLGQNVVVLPGVRIGRNAVVGANSVVRDDIPDYAVAVGAPAVVKRIIVEST